MTADRGMELTPRRVLPSLFALGAACIVIASAFVPQIAARILKRFPAYGIAFHHLPGYPADTGNPNYGYLDQPVPLRIDDDALRRAGSLLADDATYAVVVRNNEQALFEVKRDARLFLLPALAVTNPRRAGWILTYRSPLPTGVHGGRSYVIGSGFVLTKVLR
ncbi:MAG: hypothetical protein M3P18_26800 [Actinomycetota bacterium]|nr:hypothetical protein [Actinomycetota bacterium]